MVPVPALAERDPLSEGQESGGLAQGLESQAVWGEAVMSVSEGLTSGKRWIWDEAARKVATLLAAPAAFQGEHFLQVLLSPYSAFLDVVLLPSAAKLDFESISDSSNVVRQSQVQGERGNRWPSYWMPQGSGGSFDLSTFSV